MGLIKYEEKHKFPNGHVWVIWDGGDEYGYEIDLITEEGFGGDLVDLGNWSFGYKDWSHDLWEKWGDYIHNRLEAIEEDEDELENFVKELERIDCTFHNYFDDVSGSEHLKDLKVVKQLVSEM